MFWELLFDTISSKKVTWAAHLCHIFKNYRFLCGYLLNFLWTFYPNQRQRNLYLCLLLPNDYFLLFSIRTPRKQSSSCPFFSGQAVLRLWWNMSSVALASSSICLRRPASSPSCWQVSLCHKWLWMAFPEVAPSLFFLHPTKHRPWQHGLKDSTELTHPT